MKEKSHEFECELDIRKRPIGTQHKPHTNSKEKLPPIVRMLVLAHQIERAIAEGRATSLTEVARQLGVSQPRITQIKKLCLLMPDIQAKILLSDAKQFGQLSEHRLRVVTCEKNLRTQVASFDRLIECHNI